MTYALRERTRITTRRDLLVVFGVAVLMRLGAVLTSAGGLGGNFGYDPGVYFASADALVHGRLPYRDFVLLHPPGIMLALSPFAILGRLIGDHHGFILASLTFEALAALNAVLVVVLARSLGLSRPAALVGGLFYAMWFGAVNAELSTRLEPLGTAAFLTGLVLLTRSDRTDRRLDVAAGAALAATVSVKIWWIVPVVVVLVWFARQDAGRQAWRRLLGGAAGLIVLVDGPFLLAAPARMWRMVVLDQLGRNVVTAPLQRMRELTGLDLLFPQLAGTALQVALVSVVVLGILVMVAAWPSPRGRLIVVLAATQVLVLAVSPSYFSYYSGYLAAAFALVVAAAAHGSRARRFVAALTSVLAASATLAILTTRAGGLVPVLPADRLGPAVARARCVVADTPMALIGMNVLSRGLADGCPNWVDVSGRTYDVDAPAVRGTHRSQNALWQWDLRNYLLSGDAVIAARSATGLSGPLRRELGALPVLGTAHGWTVHRVPDDDDEAARDRW